MRILLDSNIWRYLLDAGAIPALRNQIRRTRHSIVVAPAVLYEAAHLKDESLRNALIAAMTGPGWKRLMPEAFSEAEELKRSIRKLRPEWIRPRPNLDRFKKIRYDWIRAHGGLWDRMKEDALLLQRHEERTGFGERARIQAHALRKDAETWPQKWREIDLMSFSGRFAGPRRGWNGAAVEPWRMDALNVFVNALNTQGHPMWDWIEGEIDVALMMQNPESFGKFWYHDVDLLEMPRHWIRWAFEFMQRQHRVTNGTPADAQLGTYLIESDLLLSSDRVFVKIADHCRDDAPFRIARSKLIPAGAAAVSAVLEAIDT